MWHHAGMDTLRIRIPVDSDDREVTVLLDPKELEKAHAGREAGACVTIQREGGAPLHTRALVERVAA